MKKIENNKKCIKLDEIYKNTIEVYTVVAAKVSETNSLTVALHIRVFSDPRVGNAMLSPVLNNTVPSGSTTL